MDHSEDSNNIDLCSVLLCPLRREDDQGQSTVIYGVVSSAGDSFMTSRSAHCLLLYRRKGQGGLFDSFLLQRSGALENR